MPRNFHGKIRQDLNKFLHDLARSWMMLVKMLNMGFHPDFHLHPLIALSVTN